jgi:hypothetical protein
MRGWEITMTMSKKEDFLVYSIFWGFIILFSAFFAYVMISAHSNWNRESTICNENGGVYVKQYGGKYICIYNAQAGEVK